MTRRISIRRLIQAIERLPSDKARVQPGKWYRTQKEHWLGWLREYRGPGYYGREASTRRDAEFVYNHIVEPRMLVWLIDAAGVEPKLVKAAKPAAVRANAMSAKWAAIRRQVPWEDLASVLWDH